MSIPPLPRAAHVAMAHKGDLLVFGGECPSDAPAQSSVRRFSPRTGTWSEVLCEGQAPRGRVAAAGCVVGDERLYLFGGFDPDADAVGTGDYSGAGSMHMYSGALHVLDLRSEPHRWRVVAADSLGEQLRLLRLHLLPNATRRRLSQVHAHRAPR